MQEFLSVHDQSIWTPLTAPTAVNIDEIHFVASYRPYEKSTAFGFFAHPISSPSQEREQLNCKRKVDRSVVDALRRNLAFNAVGFSGEKRFSPTSKLPSSSPGVSSMRPSSGVHVSQSWLGL